MGTKRFSPTRNFSKKNIGEVPKDKPGVYKIRNKQGNNIYTGVFKRGQGQNRLKDHLPEGGDSIPRASGFQIKQMPSIERAKVEEKKIIKNEKPKYNERT